MLLLLSSLVCAAPLCDVPAGPCATAALHLRCVAPARVPEPAPPPDHKPSRDAFGTHNSELETENFAIKWGSLGSITQADAQNLADAFEASWATEIDEMGWPLPDGGDEYRFNVYIGDTGPPGPDSLGNAGYFWYDDNGWPMIVIGAATVKDHPAAQITAAHEFNHALQAAANTYQYEGNGAWYHEAVATWIESEVFPRNEASSGLFFGFAYLPELPLNYFSYPDSGATDEFHQYGAFVWLQHLDDTYGRDLVTDSWLDAPFDDNPLDVVDGMIDEDLSDVFFDFTDRNADWDYDDGDLWLASLDYFGGYESDWSHRPTGEMVMEAGWQEPLEPLWIETYGANYWRITPSELPTRFDFEGYDGPEKWHAALVARNADGREVFDLDAENGFGLVDVTGLDAYDEVWLVVAATASTDAEAGWAFNYRIRMRGTPEGVDLSEVCSCRSGPAGAPLWLILVATIGLRRRRSS